MLGQKGKQIPLHKAPIGLGAWQVLALLLRVYRVRSAAVLMGLLKIALGQTHAIHQN